MGLHGAARSSKAGKLTAKGERGHLQGMPNLGRGSGHLPSGPRGIFSRSVQTSGYVQEPMLETQGILMIPCESHEMRNKMEESQSVAECHKPS